MRLMWRRRVSAIRFVQETLTFRSALFGIIATRGHDSYLFSFSICYMVIVLDIRNFPPTMCLNHLESSILCELQSCLRNRPIHPRNTILPRSSSMHSARMNSKLCEYHIHTLVDSILSFVRSICVLYFFLLVHLPFLIRRYLT